MSFLTWSGIYKMSFLTWSGIYKMSFLTWSGIYKIVLSSYIDSRLRGNDKHLLVIPDLIRNLNNCHSLPSDLEGELFWFFWILLIFRLSWCWLIYPIYPTLIRISVDSHFIRRLASYIRIIRVIRIKIRTIRIILLLITNNFLSRHLKTSHLL